MDRQPSEWTRRVARWLNRQPRWLLALGVLFVLGLGAVLLGDMRGPAADQAIPGVEADPSLNSTALALGVFVRLILVVIAIYIGAILLRRWQTGNLKRTDRQLAVLETLHLSQRRSIHLVRAGEQVFLVGSTDQAVTLLGQVPAAGQKDSGKTSGLSFDEQLAQANQLGEDKMGGE